MSTSQHEQSDHNRRLGAYVLMVVLVVVGLWSLQRTIESVQQESQRAILAECQIAHIHRQALREIVFEIGQPPLDATNINDREVREALEAREERTAAFRERVLERLPPVDCHDLLEVSGDD